MKMKSSKQRGRPRLATTKEKTTLTFDVNIKKLSNRLAFNRGIYLSELIEKLLKAEIKKAPELKTKNA